VNDIAERGVALMNEYNKLHTNNEEQKQYLLLVVKEYRHRYPDRNKETLMQ
jgi:adenylate/nucleoside-diphosphate kinase